MSGVDSELLNTLGPRWDLDWLVHSQWAQDTFPSPEHRERWVLDHLMPELDEARRAIVRRSLASILATDGVLPGLDVLCRHVHDLRVGLDVPVLAPLELALVMIDAARRHLAPNPFLHAVDAVGWVRVPEALAEVALELGLAVRARSHGMSTSPAIPTAGEEEPANEEPDHEIIVPDSDEVGELSETVVGYRAHRRAVAAHRSLVSLGRLAEAIAGSEARIDWRRELGWGDHGRVGGHRIHDVPRMLLGMLEQLPRTEPRCLELYELIADTAGPDLRDSVERSARVFAESLGGARRLASVTLRAAVRRLALGDHEDAVVSATQAFAAMTAAGDRRGACIAACVLGHELADDEPTESIEWCERALGLAEGVETPELRSVLLVALFDGYSEAGNELGQRRVLERARAMQQEHPDLDGLVELLEAWSEEPELELDSEPPKVLVRLPKALLEADELLLVGNRRAGSERVSAYIGELFESHEQDEVVEVLTTLVDGMGNDRAVRAWLSEAVAELVEDDFERWRVYKTIQLRARDHFHVLDDPDEIHVPELGTVVRSLALFRTRSCIAEAEQALADGATARAQFWVEQARYYRAQADG